MSRQNSFAKKDAGSKGTRKQQTEPQTQDGQRWQIRIAVEGIKPLYNFMLATIGCEKEL